MTLTALEIHFKCKGVDGVILCEDSSSTGIRSKPGELFGQDDAVFITAKAITSVDVTLCNVYNGKRVVHLDGIKRVRLRHPAVWPPELQRRWKARMNRTGLKYQPQVFENGWYCLRCLPPTEEDTGLLLECGARPYPVAERAEHSAAARCPAQTRWKCPSAPRLLPQRLLQYGAYPHRGRSPCRPAAPVEEPTRSGSTGCRAGLTRIQPISACPRCWMPRPRTAFRRCCGRRGTRVMPAAARRPAPAPVRQPAPVEEDEEYEDNEDSVAEALIRWVPPITAILYCSHRAVCGFVYYQFVL